MGGFWGIRRFLSKYLLLAALFAVGCKADLVA